MSQLLVRSHPLMWLFPCLASNHPPLRLFLCLASNHPPMWLFLCLASNHLPQRLFLCLASNHPPMLRFFWPGQQPASMATAVFFPAVGCPRIVPKISEMCSLTNVTWPPGLPYCNLYYEAGTPGRRQQGQGQGQQQQSGPRGSITPLGPPHSDHKVNRNKDVMSALLPPTRS